MRATNVQRIDTGGHLFGGDTRELGLPMFITPNGLRRRDWKQVPAGWLIESRRPLTGDQIAAARDAAAQGGLSIEVQRQKDASLTRAMAIATGFGFFLRLVTSAAISRGAYYEGSFYDLAWIVPYLGFLWAALMVGGAVLMGFTTRAFPHLAPVFPFFITLSAMTALAFVAIPTKLQVGADGLHLKWLRTARFIPYGDVARIDPYEDPGGGKNKLAGLMVILKSGESVRIPIMSKRSTVRDEI